MLKLNIKTRIVIIFFVIIFVTYPNIAYTNNKLLSDVKYKKIKNEIIGLKMAVKAHPSNIHIRTRLGCLYLKINELEKALEQFVEVSRLKPQYYKAAVDAVYLYRKMGKDDLAEQEFKKVAKYGDLESKKKAELELGDIAKTRYRHKLQELTDSAYEACNKGETEKAISSLEELTKIEPENVQFRVDLGHVYISIGRYKEAIRELEFLRSENQLSYEGRIALGFAYDQTDKTEPAKREYSVVASGKNPTWAAEAKMRLEAIEKRAKKAPPVPKEEPLLKTIANVPLEPPKPIPKISREVSKKKPFPIQLDSISFNSTYYERFGNAVFDITMRQYLFPESPFKPLEVYLEENFIRDTKSKGGELPDIYSDNILQVGLGVRLKPIETEYLYLYGIGYGGRKLIKEGGNYREYGDFRSGINYYKGWGTHYLPKMPAETVSFIMKEWGEFSFDISCYNRFDNNVIGYFDVREGEKILQVKDRDLDGYLRSNIIVDSRGEYYNNLTEVGMGFRFQLIPKKSFYISCEKMWGFYFGREAADPNPYGNHYHDLRIQISTYYEW